MANKFKKILLIISLIIGVQHLCKAQSFPAPKVDTLLDYFDSKSAHKDGYDFAGHILDLPVNTAQKCDKKLTRIIVKATAYKTPRNVVDENHDTIIYQERNVDYFLSDSEKAERKKYWIGTSLEILSISTWNLKKREWDVIYRNVTLKAKH